MANLTAKRLLDLSVIDHIKYKGSRNGVAESTRRNLRTIGSQYNAYIKASGQRVDADSISGFLGQLQKKQSPNTANLSRMNLKKVISNQPGIRDSYLKLFMVDEIFSDIKPVRSDKKITNYLSQAEVLKLILASRLEVAIIIEFLFKTGARISELIGIRIMDVKVDRQVHLKLIGKSNKERTVFIDQELYHRIRKEFKGMFYLFEKNGRQLNRFKLYREIKHAGRKVLNRDIHPHLLRHSTANYLLKDCNRNPKFVSEYLGNSMSVTLEMYVHERPGAEVVDLFSLDRRQEGKKSSR